MAIYHLRVKTFSRAKNQSAIAAAAYRAGLKLYDQRTNKTHNYLKRSGVVETKIILPENVPRWANDAQMLWCEAEYVERRKDATVAREFEIALPRELTNLQRAVLAEAIARALVERYGFAVQTSIHAPGPNSDNHHVHMLATTRRIDEHGFGDKTRELDGGASGKIEIEWSREMVARVINEHLAAAGVDATVDHRSLKDQARAAEDAGDTAKALALTREPTVHQGKDATAIARRGGDAKRKAMNDAIKTDNESQFEAALAQFARQGLAMPPAHDSHGTQLESRARRKHAEKVFDEGSILMGLRTPEMIAAERERPKTTKLDLRRRTVDKCVNEARALWALPFKATAGVVMTNTTDLMARLDAIVDTHREHALLASYLARLVSNMRALKRAILMLVRLRTADLRATTLLLKAYSALESFDEHHPRPGTLSPADWKRRRDQRVRMVERREKVAADAAAAYSDQVKVDCRRAITLAVEALEAWSWKIVHFFPQSVPRITHPDAEEAAKAESSIVSLEEYRQRRTPEGPRPPRP